MTGEWMMTGAAVLSTRFTQRGSVHGLEYTGCICVCLRECLCVCDLPHITTAASSTFKGVYGLDSTSVQRVCKEPPETARINTGGRKERQHKTKRNLGNNR